MVMGIGGVPLKNKSLSLKIMLYYGLMSALLIVIIFTHLKTAFYDYYYDDIFNMLSTVVNESDPIRVSNSFLGNDISNPYKIQILIFNERQNEVTSSISDSSLSEASRKLIDSIQASVKNQKDPIMNYIIEVDDNKLFYVIKKDFEVFSVGNNTYRRHIVALRWNTNNLDLKNNLLSKALFIIIVAFLIMIIFSYIASRMITYPLSHLVKSVKKIGNRNLNEPIQIFGDDEISEMGNAIEDMRVKLADYESHEKFKLHSISHELKTPIMIIKSYLECFKSDIYVNNDKIKTIEILQNECDNMESMIKDLLTIQKLDYSLEFSNLKCEDINISDIVESCFSRHNTGEVELFNNIHDVYYYSNYEHITTLINNLISNQVRYARSKIQVDSYIDNSNLFIKIFNDGENILNIDKIFEMFHKGPNGNSGLGLYICKKIISIYRGDIVAENQSNGVIFTISLPNS